MSNIKADFPLFKKNPKLIYLDNAATTHKPYAMLDAMSEYYIEFNSNVGRGLYELAQLSESAYSKSKKIVAEFLGCSNKNIIYTSGCTESLNLAGYIAQQKIKDKKKYIILPISEHHANVLIWQAIAEQNNLELYWISDPDLILEPKNINHEILKNTAIMAVAHVSNVTGEVYPVKEWCKVAKEIGAISIIDGAQAVTSLKINIKDIGCDFYAFSAHKLYGPMGLGVLYINNEYFNSNPLKLGGGIIEDVEQKSYTLLEGSNRFEAGTPNVANAYAFGKTIEFLNENNWEQILKNTHSIGNYLEQELIKIGVTPLSISSKLSKTHISSFRISGIHAHDVGTYLAQKDIAVRVGKHCAYPLHAHLKVNSSIRASIGIYNTKEDVDILINAIKECISYFNKDIT
jgi:cysteine desulfurase/selenocysteine lyase